MTLAAALVLALGAAPAPAAPAFVRVSPRDARYLETTDGRPYLPIGLNLVAPDRDDEAAGLARMDEWLGKLAANGGNFARIWLSSPFWDVEHERSGVYDEAKARRTDALVSMARRHGVRLKLTIEHFREMSDAPRQPWANKPLHRRDRGGTASGMGDFFSGEESRARFRKKLAWLADRYRDEPAVFGVELWNEVNAVRAEPAEFMPWTEAMLGELHRLFPRTLALQSLGSFDTDAVRELYRRHSRLPANDLAQVHRYLDLGAALDVCHGPVDVLAADAVRELLAFEPGKPVLLAESGAVEPSHSGPSKLYALDRSGTLLHDVLFAPFFAGAAGPGHAWHWEAYVDRNDLWWHFGRFAAAADGLDPAAEGFRPRSIAHPRLRVRVLDGRRTTLAWLRDAQDDWRAELRDGREPEALAAVSLPLDALAGTRRAARVRAFDPWTGEWTTVVPADGAVRLPAFRRSLVVRVDLEPPSFSASGRLPPASGTRARNVRDGRP